jgi:hypothetical protein
MGLRIHSSVSSIICHCSHVSHASMHVSSLVTGQCSTVTDMQQSTRVQLCPNLLSRVLVADVMMGLNESQRRAKTLV